MASPGITYKVGVDSKDASRGVEGVLSSITKGGPALGIAFAGIGGAVTAIRGLIDVVQELGQALNVPIQAAARLETLETAFNPLLGGSKAAKERLDELSKFAAKTPFELPEVAAASRTLETLTNGALSTGAGLTMIGDVASATNQPFQEIATTVGRLYSGLQNGRPVGEAMARLSELGIISGETRNRIEALQASGAKGDEVWAVAEAAMGKFGGSMELQSQTWNGRMSSLSDAVSMAMATFGEPIIDQIGPYIEDLIALIESLSGTIADWGTKFAQGFATVIEAFKSGAIFDLVVDGLIVAFGTAVNVLAKGLVATVQTAGWMFMQRIELVWDALKMMTSADFWVARGKIILGVFLTIAAKFGEVILDTVAAALDLIPGLDGKEATAAGRQMVSYAGESGGKMITEGTTQVAAEAGALFVKFMDPLVKGGEQFAKYFNEAGDLIDVSGHKQNIANVWNQQGAAAEQRAAQERTKREAVEAKLNSQRGNGEAEGQGPADKVRGGDKVDADRLAKIGGYVGQTTDTMRTKLAERQLASSKAIESISRNMERGISTLVAKTGAAGATF